MGSPLPSVNCAIMGEDGTELPTGQTGEITVVGDSVMRGYYNNPEATATAIRDGRLWTGDLGFMDEDGFLTVVGRERALLVSESGAKYSPESIEEAVMAGTGLIEQTMAWCLYRKNACAIVSLDIARTKAFIDGKGIKTAEQLCHALQDEFYRFRKMKEGQPIQDKWIPIAFQIIGGQFGEQDGTINSTLKLVRRKVEEIYGELIEYSYTDEGSTTVNPKNIATLKALFGL
jgi:long-chain acyl-CoA synthetase